MGLKGGGSGEFVEPVGVAVDAAGQVYVSDNGNGRLQIFTRDGKFVNEFSRTGWEARCILSRTLPSTTRARSGSPFRGRGKCGPTTPRQAVADGHREECPARALRHSDGYWLQRQESGARASPISRTGLRGTRRDPSNARSGHQRAVWSALIARTTGHVSGAHDVADHRHRVGTGAQAPRAWCWR